jgi:hypothetical protein
VSSAEDLDYGAHAENEMIAAVETCEGIELEARVGLHVDAEHSDATGIVRFHSAPSVDELRDAFAADEPPVWRGSLRIEQDGWSVEGTFAAPFCLRASDIAGCE